MKFTFIVTTYNTNIKDFEEMCISLKNQKYSNWNLIYSDDGSDEINSKKYLDILKIFDIEKIAIMNNKNNLGICAIRDALINKFQDCIGDYMITLDSDDYISCDFITNIHLIVEKENPDIIKFNSLNWVLDKNNFRGVEKDHKLLESTFAFNRIYKWEQNMLDNSNYISLKYRQNINDQKMNRYIDMASNMLCGPVSTIFKYEFYKKNKLKYTLPSGMFDEEKIKKNLDFFPVLSCNWCDYDLVIISKNSGYYYRYNSSSSVTRTFINNEIIINKILILLFSVLLEKNYTNLNLSHMLFTYCLRASYINSDKKRLFYKFFKSKVGIKSIQNISLIEKIAYSLSRNKFTRIIFGIISLII